MPSSLLTRAGRALLVVLPLALALLVAGCALFRDDYVLGTGLSLLRWPSLALAGLIALAATRLSSSRTKQLALAGALGIALVHGADFAHEALTRMRPKSPSSASKKARPLSVLSYNVLFEGGDPARVVETLLAADADLVVLQEVTPAWRERLDVRLSSRYPYSRERARRGTLGYAVYSRFPLGEARSVGHPRLPHAQVMTVDLNGQRIALANVHLYAPAASLHKEGMDLVEGLYDNAAVRERQWRELRAFLDERYGKLPHLVVGDFNTMEHEPLYREMEQAYVDAFRVRRFMPGFTWPALGKLPPLVRIDYVLASPHFLVEDARVLEGGSDHRAVLAKLRL